MTQRNSAMNVFIGIVATFFGHIVAVGLLGLLTELLNAHSSLGNLFFFSLFGVGIAQLFYVLPLIAWLYSKRRYDTMKGVIIGAVLTFLLNGSCFVLFWSNFG